MKVLDVPSADLKTAGRLDAQFHLSEGRRIAIRFAKTKSKIAFRPLTGSSGLGRVWAPSRFKRVYTVEGEAAVPYLRPYDVFSYLPRPADFLSATRSPNLNDYRIARGMILMTCSGRNLGPAVLVDEFLARFVLSHDIIRLEITDERMRLYVLAYLATPTAQHLLRRDKSGSVIDHITIDHAASQEVPIVGEVQVDNIVSLMRRAVRLREQARIGLQRRQEAYEAILGKAERRQRLHDGWTVPARGLLGRIDAAPYDPLVVRTKEVLLRSGGQPVRDVAEVVKPAGRYRTIYVDRDHGLPILSGAQILQFRPINLKYIATRALSDVAKYRLRAGWVVYQADGRAEEALGDPVMITRDRDGWLASGHVGRLAAKDGVSPGHLFLALRTPHAQAQIKALASGSVVDSTFPEDMEQVVLPPFPEIDGADVERLWDKFVEAQEAEDRAVAIIERELEQLGASAA